MKMRKAQETVLFFIAFSIGVNCAILENSDGNENENITRADDLCRRKCGWDLNIECSGEQTTDETTICGCKDTNRRYDKEIQKCKGDCLKSPCQNEGTCRNEGEDNTCDCKPPFFGEFCEKNRCAIKCGVNTNIKCEGEQTTDYTTECGCKLETMIYDSEKKTCEERCSNKCGADPKIECKGNQTTDDTTECGCYSEALIYNTEKKVCEVACKTNDDCKSFEKCNTLYSGKKTCGCLSGKSGEKCEIVDDCVTGQYKDCKGDNGRCLYNDEKESAECDCGDVKVWDNRWYGKRCLTPCNDDCKNNGKCSDYGQYKFCDCRRGTRGDLCENVDDCNLPNFCGTEEDVICEYDYRKDGGKCTCKDPNKLFDPVIKKCKIPCKTSDDCQSFEKCTYLNSGGRFCRCPRGKSGEQCEIVDACATDYYKFCKGDNGTCRYNDEKQRAECDCADGKIWDDRFHKRLCKTPCNDDCKNHGVCRRDGDYKFCDCKPGTSGDLCQTVDDCSLYPNFCGKEEDTQCDFDDDLKRRSKCTCKDMKKLYDPDARECRIPCKTDDDCLSFERCKTTSSGEMVCKCPSGKSGINCEIVDDCETGQYALCKGDSGKCIYNDKDEKAECDCGVGKVWDNRFFGKRCLTQCNDHCKHNGKCSEYGEYKFCDCKAGTSGDLCEIVDNCRPGWNYICGTGEDVKCEYDFRTSRAKCTCKDPNKLFDFSSRKCRRDICAEYVCQNGGICRVSGDAPRCDCKPPFSGERCEIAGSCKEYVCQNGGICNDDSGSPICYCKAPFSGRNCEKDPCTPNPCRNGGTCTVAGMMFKCTCKGLITGATCDNDNRMISLSVLVWIVLGATFMICNGCCLLRINHKLTKRAFPKV